MSISYTAIVVFEVFGNEFYNVRKDLSDTEGVMGTLSKADQEEYYERNQANRARAQAEAVVERIKRQIRAAKNKNEPTDELAKQQEEAEKLVKRYSGKMEGMEVSTKAIFSHRALPVGVNLKGRLVVIHPRDRDLEMLEFALDALSKDPVLGAQSARGCGEIKGVFDVLIEGELRKKITIGDYTRATIDEF